MEWFNCDFMGVNSAKFQVIFLGTNDNSVGLNIDGTYMTSAESAKLLYVTIDSKLSFLPYVCHS